MFNLGAGEIAVIMIVALLLLGPDKLPELARGIGKFVREFRRQTDDVRGLVEREFYKMDQEVGPEGELAPPTYPSVFPPPEGAVAARPSSAEPFASEPPAPSPAEPAAPASEPVVSARPEGEPPAHG